MKRLFAIISLLAILVAGPYFYYQHKRSLLNASLPDFPPSYRPGQTNPGVSEKAQDKTASRSQKISRKKKLVLDPGHGGYDSGCMCKLSNGQCVVEDEVVYDVCCRVKKILEAHGFTIFFTIYDTKTEFAIRNEAILPPDENEILVEATELKMTGKTKAIRLACLEARVAIIKKVTADEDENNPSWIGWLSVHFDSENNVDLQGTSFVTPQEGPFTKALKQSFDSRHLLRVNVDYEYFPVVINGDARLLYVLRDDINKIPSRVLIELGNIENPTDRSWMGRPVKRQLWAEAIAEGIQNASQ